MPGGAAYVDEGVVCGHSHGGKCCNRLFQGKKMTTDFLLHMRNHVRQTGKAPATTELAKIGAVACPTCSYVGMPTADGKCRKHSCGANSREPPPAKRRRPADDADAEAKDGDEGGEGKADDADAEANPAANQGNAGKPRFTQRRPAMLFIATFLMLWVTANTVAEREDNLEKFLTTPLNSVYRPLRKGEGADLSHGPNPVPVQPAGVLGFMSNALRALREIADRQLSRAMRCLKSMGKAAISNLLVQANIASKYPKRPPNAVTLQCPPLQIGAVPDLTEEMIKTVILKKAPKTAPGLSGWSFSDLQCFVKESERASAPPALRDFVRNLTQLSNCIAKGELDNDRFRPLLTELRGVGLRKDVGSNDTRPIGINSVFVATTTGALKRVPEIVKLLAALVTRRAFSHATSGGAEAIPHMIRAKLATMPGAVAAQLDLENAFNSLDRQHVLEIIVKAPCLGPMIKMLYGHGPTTVDFSDEDTVFKVAAEMGVTQGDGLSMEIFDIVMTTALKLVEADLPNNLMLVRYADDIWLVGLPADVFATIDKITEALKPTGLKVKPAKTYVYVPATVDEDQRELTNSLVQARGFKITNGLVACGGLVGTQQFCEAEAAKIVGMAVTIVDRVVDVALCKESPKEMSIQAALVLLRFCLCPSALVYFVRTTPQTLMGNALKTFDDAMASAVMRILAVHEFKDDLSRELYRSRLQLDLVVGGLGLPSIEHLADNAFFGCFALTSCLAGRVLPQNFDSTLAFSDAQRLIEGGIMNNVPSLEAYKNVADFLLEPVMKVQAVLTHTGRTERQKKVLNQLDDQGKADLLSGSSAEASAWLTTIPGKDLELTMSNAVTVISWKMRLGLDTTNIVSRHEGPNIAVVCLACEPAFAAAHAANSKSEKIRTAALIINDSGMHIFPCKGGGKGSVSGCINGVRHNATNSAVENAYKRNSSRPDVAAVSVQHEPHMALHADPKAGAKQTDKRADFSLRLAGGRVELVDTTIIHAGVNRFKTAASVAGTAAERARVAKVKFYDKHWALHQGTSLVVASFEAGGRWHPEFLSHFKRFVKSAYPDDKERFVYNFKASVQRISIALRKTTSEAVLLLDHVAKGYPAVRLGAVVADAVGEEGQAE